MSVSSTSLSLSERRSAPVAFARLGVIGALIARDWRILRSYRTALVTDLLFGCLNLLAYRYISRTLGARVHGGLDGAPDYFAFAAVGVSLSVVLQAAIAGVSARLREEQLTGTLEALCAQPVSGAEMALGLAGFPFLFAVLRAFLYLLIAGVLLGLSFAHCAWFGLLAAFAASGLALGAVGVGLAALVLVFKRAGGLGGVGAFAMSLLGGAFFPVRVLPHWLQPLASAVPTRYAFTAARSALFGRPGWPAATLELLAFGLVLGAISVLLFNLALRHAVRRGTLNQY